MHRARGRKKKKKRRSARVFDLSLRIAHVREFNKSSGTFGHLTEIKACYWTERLPRNKTLYLRLPTEIVARGLSSMDYRFF